MLRLSKRIVSFVLTICIIISCFSSFLISAYAVTYMGDVDADSKIGSNDALLILQHATGLKFLNTNQVKIADLSGDGKVNSNDALLVLQTSTGIISQKPYEGSDSEISFKATVTADPTLNLREGAGTSYSTLANIPNKTVLTISKISNNWGQTVYNGKTGWVNLSYVKVDNPVSGTFTVEAYGYGHGVGMSQHGARLYAKQGWTYDKILLHYYYSDKTKIEKDSTLPKTVEYGGKELDLKTYIAGSVMAEIGQSDHLEAIKAQAVVIYTYAKYYGFVVSSSNHAYKENYNYKGTKIETAMNEILGEYVSYNGKAILSVYCSSMGGKNTSAKNAWNGTDLAYLQGGRTSPEPESTMKRSYIFSANEVKEMVSQGLGITLTGSPDTWFTNIVHDKSISNSIGYIKSMKVGSTVVYGERVRTKVFRYNVRSHCLSIKYNP